MTAAQVKKELLTKVRNLLLVDTTKRVDFADMCSDIVHTVPFAEACDKFDLSRSTVIRLRENVKPYNPTSRTVEKVLQHSKVKLNLGI